MKIATIVPDFSVVNDVEGVIAILKVFGFQAGMPLESFNKLGDLKKYFTVLGVEEYQDNTVQSPFAAIHKTEEEVPETE